MLIWKRFFQGGADPAMQAEMEQFVFSGRVALQQRVLPEYRRPFFDALARACTGGLSVFAGQPVPQENVRTARQLDEARFVPARNRNIFPIESGFYHCWQSGLLRWLEDWQPDVLVVEANPRYPSTRLAVRWMHSLGRPVIGWGLGAPPISAARTPWGGLAAWWRRWERLSLLRSLDAIIAYSHQGARQYRALGLPLKDIAVALNAVSQRPDGSFSPQREVSLDIPVVVLFVGRLQARKRVDILLQACAALPVEIQPHLRVVGDGPARTDLERLAARIYPRAEFHGALHGPQLESVFAAADLFVLPGTGGLAVQQAMAHALPVIVAEGDGTQGDLVRPGNGLLVPTDDVSALSAALEACLSDPARLRQMGVESYRIVVEEVNIETMVEVFVNTFKKVAG
jgi:glycosyltransferase involved in cell wall biosynthesis